MRHTAAAAVLRLPPLPEEHRRFPVTKSHSSFPGINQGLGVGGGRPSRQHILATEVGSQPALTGQVKGRGDDAGFVQKQTGVPKGPPQRQRSHGPEAVPNARPSPEVPAAAWPEVVNPGPCAPPLIPGALRGGGRGLVCPPNGSGWLPEGLLPQTPLMNTHKVSVGERIYFLFPFSYFQLFL